MAIATMSARMYAREAKLAELGGGRELQAISLPPVSFDPQKDQTWVVGPQVFAFLKGVTADRREMIANSALFASLVADAATSRDQAGAWYDAYTGALENLGWVLQESTKRTFAQEHAGSQVHEAVLEFITAVGVGGGALALITAALKSLQKVEGEDKPWITLFDYQTRQQNISGFQVGLVEDTAEGAFQVKLMNFSLEMKQTKAQVLFINFGQLAIRMDSIANTVTVAEDVLREAMPDLKSRLQQYVKRYVAEVKLPAL